MTTPQLAGSASTTDGRDIIETLLQAVEERSVDTILELVAPDFVMEWPQSGERFSGRDNALAAWLAQDDVPTIDGELRIVGGGDVWVATMPLRYGEERVHYVGIFELRDGVLTRSTEYFGSPFPAKEARSAYRDD